MCINSTVISTIIISAIIRNLIILITPIGNVLTTIISTTIISLIIAAIIRNVLIVSGSHRYGLRQVGNEPDRRHSIPQDRLKLRSVLGRVLQAQPLRIVTF